MKEAAESYFMTYTSNNYTCDDFQFYNSKAFKLYRDHDGLLFPEDMDENSTYQGPNLTDYLPLYDDWRRYYQVPVSINASTVHVPTNIYECGK